MNTPECLQQSLDLLYRLATPYGFLASLSEQNNYKRIWGRDHIIIGLAALQTAQKALIESFRYGLTTLSHYQGPHGEIPSNVNPETGHTSYGNTVGRVDSNLWFIIGCGQYLRRTGDIGFLTYLWPSIERVKYLLGAWEFNNRRFLYIPQSGDWADEYIQYGYILYDQLLYLQSQREYNYIRSTIFKTENPEQIQDINKLINDIRNNYWIGNYGNEYHSTLYRSKIEAALCCANKYWVPYFFIRYGFRFDAFANTLVSLFDVSDEEQNLLVDNYIDSIINKNLSLLPAYYPVITTLDPDWENLKNCYTFKFRNRPNEYHNGGLWPMITGFYVAACAKRNRMDRAKQFYEAICYANKLPLNGNTWSFPEYLNGETLAPSTIRYQGWSAAATIISASAIEGNNVFLT